LGSVGTLRLDQVPFGTANLIVQAWQDAVQFLPSHQN
jgi:hypothetical protein